MHNDNDNRKAHMFTADAARIIGIEPKALRNFLRNRSKGVGSGAHYEFTYEEVEQLGKDYWAWTASKPTRKRRNNGELDEGTPGLPTKWLHDPDHQAEFVAERKLRIERLNARIREVGLSVPQMTDRVLKLNGRAIAAAILKGEVECE